MADEQKQQDENLQDKQVSASDSSQIEPDQPPADPDTSQPQKQDQIFRDLLEESRIAPLQISEPEFDSFDVQSVIQEAKAVSRPSSRSLNPFGKRSRKNRTRPAAEEHFFTPKAAQAGKTETPYTSAGSAIAQSAAQSEHKDSPSQPVKTLSASSSAPGQAAPAKPRTFAEILNSSRYRQNQQAIETLDQQLEVDEADIQEEGAKKESGLLPAQTGYASSQTETSVQDQLPASQLTAKTDGQEDSLPLTDHSEPAGQPDNQPEMADGIQAPGQDDEHYNYEEYEDKKRFSTTDYKKIEEYLSEESARGFHFIRSDGSNYYFAKAAPALYYYRVLYFAKEPDESYWQDLEKQGWKKIDTIPSRHKRDAGWTIVRNEKKSVADLPKEIANEEEKYRYFTKLSSSCRSTMFLLFFVMICSAVAIFLQYYFKGYMAVIIASAVLFFIALWMFLVYARMLSKARKQASLLSARIRLAENDPGYQALRHAGESDSQLDQDWNALDADSPEDLSSQDDHDDPAANERSREDKSILPAHSTTDSADTLEKDDASQDTTEANGQVLDDEDEELEPVSRRARRKELKKQKKAAKKARKAAQSED